MNERAIPAEERTEAARRSFAARSDDDDSSSSAVVPTLRAELVPSLVVLASLFALSAPLAFFVMGARELEDRTRATARDAAETLARYAEEQPVLWRYDSLKLVEHLRHFEVRPEVVRVDVVDTRGVPIDRSMTRPDEGLLWASAPIEVGGRHLGTVWVGSSRASLRHRAALLLLAFTLVAVALALLVHRIAYRAARRADARIARLVDELAARSAEERVRALRLAALATQEEDRRAIARDLHDSVGQALAAIRIQAELLGAHLERDAEQSHSAARKLAGDIARGADVSLEEVRRALARLRPVALDEVGLAEALTRLCHDVADQLGLEPAVEIDIGPNVSTAVETAVYRIVQEALANVVRHARGATRICVRVVERTARVLVEVEDDGPGLDDSRAREAGGGRGIVGMRERAELLGGTFCISSHTPRGTRIVAELPSHP